MKDPETREEWQEAANAAEFMLLLDSARQYGLVTGGPVGKIERCIWIVEEAKKRGITPEDLAGQGQPQAAPGRAARPVVGETTPHPRKTL